MTVVMLLIGVSTGNGTWVEIPQQLQTTGWEDCEARAHEINRASDTMLLAYCRETKVIQ